jgi:hypothetical protein
MDDERSFFPSVLKEFDKISDSYRWIDGVRAGVSDQALFQIANPVPVPARFPSKKQDGNQPLVREVNGSPWKGDGRATRVPAILITENKQMAGISCNVSRTFDDTP